VGVESMLEAETSLVGAKSPFEKTRTDTNDFGSAYEDIEYDEDDKDESEFELDLTKSKKKRRKDRQKRRQLILDEKSGEVIAKRRRKGRRGSWDDETWEDYDY